MAEITSKLMKKYLSSLTKVQMAMASVGVGIVQAVQTHSNALGVRVRLDQLSLRYLGNSDLSRVPRGTEYDTPIEELATKLYFHSHNKIAALTEDAAEFLRTYFESDDQHN